MINKHNINDILSLADIVSSIIPKEYQNKYDKNIFDQKVTFCDQFIIYCISNSFTPKTANEELLKAEVLGVIYKYICTCEESDFRFDLFDHLFLSF